MAQKAQEVGYHPEIILAGRRLNDSMGQFVASEVVKLMNKKNRRVGGAPVLILGITFKENCPDIRNSRVIDIYNELASYGCNVAVYDPWANKQEVEHEFGIKLISKEELDKGAFKAVVLAVAHNEFKQIELDGLKDGDAVVYDVKGMLPKDAVDGRL
ncbi:MAG: UDP binding domain-containing protein [Owenweeksia sp.]